MSRKIAFLFVIIFVMVFSPFAIQNSALAQHQKDETGAMPGISSQDFERGWYYGSLDQKKPGTPDDWIHDLESTRSACWHKPGIWCGGGKYEKKDIEKKARAAAAELHELIRQKQSEGADVSKALELDRKSKEAFAQGRLEECLKFLKEAIALLKNKNGSTQIQSIEPTKFYKRINRDSPFGINDAFLGGFGITSLSEGEKFLEERCRILNDLGAGWARGPSPFGVIWELVEPQKGKFDFSKADLGFKVPRKYGIQWVRGVWPYPKWEQDRAGDERQKKLYSNEADLIEYVSKAAGRYPANYWEIGNEPMLLPTFTDPKVYSKFLKASYRGIKIADPKATVLIGGMVGAEGDFERISSPYFNRILEDDGGRYFDIMNFHDYDYSDNAMDKQAQGYKKLLRNRGYEKTVWVTETGITSDVCGPDLWLQGSIEKQARWVVRGFVAGFAAGAEKVFWAALYDYPDPSFGSFGLISLHGKRKPSYYTYKLMTSKLKDFVAVRTIKAGWYQFEFSNKKTVYVLWSETGTGVIDVTDYIKTKKVKITHIVEEEGQVEPKTETTSAHAVPIGESPVFIEEAK